MRYLYYVKNGKDVISVNKYKIVYENEKVYVLITSGSSSVITMDKEKVYSLHDPMGQNFFMNMLNTRNYSEYGIFFEENPYTMYKDVIAGMYNSQRHDELIYLIKRQKMSIESTKEWLTPKEKELKKLEQELEDLKRGLFKPIAGEESNE